MKLCAWSVHKLQQHDAEFMAEIAKLTPKPKVASTSMAMASPSMVGSSDAATAAQVVQVKSEHVPSVTTDSGQMTLKWSMMPAHERRKRLETAHDAWDLFFFVHNVPFRLISTDELSYGTAFWSWSCTHHL